MTPGLNAPRAPGERLRSLADRAPMRAAQPEELPMSMNRRVLLGSAAAGAGLAAAGCAPVIGGGQVAAPPAPTVSDPQTVASLNAFMDSAWERTLDASPETVTSFGLDTGARAAAKSKLTVPTLAEEEDARSQTRA